MAIQIIRNIIKKLKDSNYAASKFSGINGNKKA